MARALQYVAGMKLSAFLASSLLLSTSFLAGCGADDPADPELDAVFSSADQLHRERAIGAALGFDFGMAYFIGGAYAGQDVPDGCPVVVTDGDRTTVTGGCDSDSGRVDGRIVLDNVPALFTDDEPDPSRPQLLTFDAYVADDDDGRWAIDGTIRFDPAAGTLATDLGVELDGPAATTSLRMTGEDGEPWTAGDGSWIDVDGIGAAAVSGTWSLDSDAPSGRMTLTGAEVLVLDLEAAVDGCIPYTIDGAAAGELCDNAE